MYVYILKHALFRLGDVIYTGSQVHLYYS